MGRIQSSSPEASIRMTKVRQTGTKAEMALRKALHRLGLRYRVNYQVLKRPRRVADLAFAKLKIAVFVDGCFWHGCPEHASWPKSNSEFWLQKIEANRARDADTDVKLKEIGWTVIRIWEHECPEMAANAIKTIIDTKRNEAKTSLVQNYNSEDDTDGTNKRSCR
ncbi:very short patch repair endonuclease [Methylomonas sp. SURF-1]|uniref:Very short patch repair endonuclease n=2 Tax=Methylomonas TaxID=416 RepID=A0ABU4U906_9GAMM|nr:MULTISPECIES: very short patch repair endonuclease [unclassified Methylomonas]MCQ8181008.1 very short patch repair endonuclease [Methylomonas sp. SURF-1]MDX8125914.1 very short patch repair endonuclease [Methylomonas sp. OY6]